MTISRNLGTLAQGASANGVLGITKGGTGASQMTANAVMLGSHTQISFVSPGPAGNVLTSDGNTWTSQAASGGSSSSGIRILFSGFQSDGSG